MRRRPQTAAAWCSLLGVRIDLPHLQQEILSLVYERLWVKFNDMERRDRKIAMLPPSSKLSAVHRMASAALWDTVLPRVQMKTCRTAQRALADGVVALLR